MRKNNHDLAAVFNQIEAAAGKLEEVAKGILSAIKHKDCRTLEHFNDMVSDAYARNGWSQKAGRPADGSTEKPAPDAVKLYVSTARAAYRIGLDVTGFETMGALRSAIRDARAKKSNGNGCKPAELRGVQVSRDGSLTGALWHDAVVLWEHLPDGEREEFEKQVRKLLSRYKKRAPADLIKAA